MTKSADATMRFTILGCGSSPGVPRIGNDWGNCDPENPKNRRRRASLLIERITSEGKTIVVVDTGPDFREQMISANISDADGVVYTHPHADHIHGIDDLRSFVINRRARVEIWADQTTSDRLHEAFGYCFKTPPGSSYPPILNENRIISGETIVIDGAGGKIELMPFDQQHGSIVSLGLRIGDLVYSSDVSDLDQFAINNMHGMKVWIVDALQYKQHPNHFNLETTLKWIDQLQPDRAILTHMHTPLDYQTVLEETPAHVEPAFDGMILTD